MPILVAIPFCHKDADLVSLNLELAESLDDKAPFDCLLTHDSSDVDRLPVLQEKAGKVFRTVHAHEYAPWKGEQNWPTPANYAWQQTARHIEAHFADKYHGWLWWESDATPLKQGWLSMLWNAYVKGKQPFAGFRVQKGADDYMNGVGIWPSQISACLPNSGALITRVYPFDRAAARESLQRFTKLNGLIEHVIKARGGGRGMSFNRETWATWRDQHPNAALLHACTDGSLANLLLGRDPFGGGELRTFRHAGDLGDIIYGLPVIKHKGGGRLFLEASGITREPMTPERIAFIQPLLEAQTYVNKVSPWRGEAEDVNLNLFREKMREDQAQGCFDARKSLAQWACETQDTPLAVLNEPWLSVDDPKRVARVVMARSARYHGPFPWKRAMAAYGRDAVFVGLPEEHRRFSVEVGSVPLYRVKDALELARLIAGAELFIGNQSFPYSIAEGLKQNAILEVWPDGPNCLFERPNCLPVDSETIGLPSLSETEKSQEEQPSTNSETSKHRRLAEPYCQGNGVDLGSGGDPVVPWAIQIELPETEYKGYNSHRPGTPIQWRGSAVDLPFKDGMLDWVHSSHLLEDFKDWMPVLAEWSRCLKPGGYLLIAVPDHQRFREAVARGQGDNLAHKHESFVGELPQHLANFKTIHDGFVSDHPHEYSILYIGRKP